MKTYTAVSSVTTKLLGKAQKHVDQSNPRVVMGRFIGIATAIFDRVGPNGEVMEGFRGAFEMENLMTGEIFTSAQAYLPNAMAEAYRNMFLTKDDEGNVVPIKGMTVSWDFNCIAVFDTNKAGFTWRFESNQKVDEANNILAVLRAQNDAMRDNLLESPKEEKHLPSKSNKKHKEVEEVA